MPRPLSLHARQQMLTATRAVIADLGPTGLTIDEVARRSGVAKTTIYRHFPNSTALLLAALSEIPASVCAPDTGSLRGDLLAIIDQFLELTADGTVRSMMIHALSSAGSDPELEQLQHDLKQGRQRPILIALQRAQRRGDLDAEINLDLAASLVDGPFIARRLVSDLTIDHTEATAMIDLALNGLTPGVPTTRGELVSSTIDTPIGRLTLVASDRGLRAVMHTDVENETGRVRLTTEEIATGTTPILVEAERQLTDYFAGNRFDFDLPLDPAGTDFQRAVWASLQSIPAGETRTYSAQADGLGKPRAIRAVAGADGKNPLAVIIPCHRIIGADGSLTGYAWGVERKRWLLNHEGVAV